MNPDLEYRLLLEAGRNPNYINKNLNERYRQDVMSNNCLTKITKSEFNHYITSNKPFLYCEFFVTPIDKHDFSYYHAIINKPLGNEYNYSFFNSSVYTYTLTDDGSKEIGFGVFDESPFNWKYNSKDLYKHQKLPKNSLFLNYDLVTTYYILKNRGSCKENVAKKAVIDTFDYIVSHTSIEKLLLYLIGHAKIMGITIPDTRLSWYVVDDPDNEDSEDNEKNLKEIQAIKAYVEKLLPMVRRHLTVLDDTVYVDQPKYILNKQYIKEYF